MRDEVETFAWGRTVSIEKWNRGDSKRSSVQQGIVEEKTEIVVCCYLRRIGMERLTFEGYKQFGTAFDLVRRKGLKR